MSLFADLMYLAIDHMDGGEVEEKDRCSHDFLLFWVAQFAARVPVGCEVDTDCVDVTARDGNVLIRWGRKKPNRLAVLCLRDQTKHPGKKAVFLALQMGEGKRAKVREYESELGETLFKDGYIANDFEEIGITLYHWLTGATKRFPEVSE